MENAAMGFIAAFLKNGGFYGKNNSGNDIKIEASTNGKNVTITLIRI